MQTKLAISAALTRRVLGARAAQGARIAPALQAAAPALPPPALRKLTLQAGSDVRAGRRATTLSNAPVPAAFRQRVNAVNELENTQPALMFGEKPQFGNTHEMPHGTPLRTNMLLNPHARVVDPAGMTRNTPVREKWTTGSTQVPQRPLSIAGSTDVTPRPSRLLGRPLHKQAGTDLTPASTGPVLINPLDAISGALNNADVAAVTPPDNSSKVAKAHKLDGRMTFRGLPISIETAKGNYRHWYDPKADKHGKTKMRYPYGYIRRTEGLDGDHVDVFVGSNEKAPYVYVVLTNAAPDFKKADEEKCMLGFDSAAAAKAAFLQHYTDPRFFRSMSTLPFAEFEKRVLATYDGPRKKVGASIPGTEPRLVQTPDPKAEIDRAFATFGTSPDSQVIEERPV